jgi:hypothetical protein
MSQEISFCRRVTRSVRSWPRCSLAWPPMAFPGGLGGLRVAPLPAGSARRRAPVRGSSGAAGPSASTARPRCGSPRSAGPGSGCGSWKCRADHASVHGLQTDRDGVADILKFSELASSKQGCTGPSQKRQQGASAEICTPVWSPQRTTCWRETAMTGERAAHCTPPPKRARRCVRRTAAKRSSALIARARTTGSSGPRRSQIAESRSSTMIGWRSGLGAEPSRNPSDQASERSSKPVNRITTQALS